MVLFFAAVLLLAAGGVAKIARPDPGALALGSLHPSLARRGWSRGLGVAELALAVAAIPGGPVTAGAVGLTYLAFAVVIAGQLRRGAGAPCGCLGDDSPPTIGHLVINLAATAAAVIAARNPLSLLDWLRTAPLPAVQALTALGALVAALLVMTRLATLLRLVATPR